MTEGSTSTRLSQAAPAMPFSKDEFPKTFGISSPLSTATIPFVYSKKLSNLFRGRLAVLPGDFTVASALKTMAKYNISSVPVIEDSMILGFVDMLDILSYLCKFIGKENYEEEFERDDTENLKDKSGFFKNTKISQIVDFSNNDPFHVMNGEESLIDAVEQYFKRVQRIGITDDNGDLIGVVSQWSIANYLATVPTEDQIWIPSLRGPVERYNFTRAGVKTVNQKDITLNCFLKMHALCENALAVIDDTGKLCGNLSASDLKGLYFKEFSDLLQPVAAFLATIRKTQGRTECFSVAVTPNSPVTDIITKFNEEIVHQVYIVDHDYKPIEVFSLANLMEGLVVNTHTVATFARARATNCRTY